MSLAAVAAAPAGLAMGALLACTRAAWLRNPPAALIGVLATCSAAAGLFAEAAPTGWGGLDAVARAAVAAGCVLLGARAGPVPVFLAAVAGPVAASGSPLQPLAAAIAGLMVITVLTSRRAPLVTAGAGGALAQIAFHLESGEIWPNTTVAAAWILAPLAVCGTVNLEAPVRRLVLRGAAALAVAGAAAGGLGLATALLARSSLDAGVSAAGEGLDAARRANGPEAAARLSAAARSFADARRTMDSWWARPARGVPVVAQHVRLLRAVASAGQQLSDVGASAVGRAELERIVVRDGQVPLDRVGTVERSIEVAVGGLATARRQLAAADSPWLLPVVERRLDDQMARLAAAEADGRRAGRVLHELPALLGAAGPRRYFLAVQTPSEMRGSGGIIGNYGEISAESGRLQLVRFGRSSDLNFFGDPESRRLVAPDDYVAHWGRFSPETVWQNITMSPDFPTVAGVVANQYEQSGGAPVDGVIAVDPAAVATLLRLVGPVEVPGWPEPLTAQNAEQILLHEQYVRLDGDARVDFLGDAVEEVWRRLTTGSLPGAGDLAGALGPALRTKHILLASTRASEQRLFVDTGVAGAMGPVTGDFLGVVAQNAGQNKIDWFLRRRVEYRVNVDPATGALHARLKIVLRNAAPREGLPPYVIANPPETGLADGHNRMYLSVYTPWALKTARIGGADVAFERAFELGRRVYSAFVVVPAGSSLTVDLQLSGQASFRDNYRLDLHHQPGTAADEVRTEFALRPSPHSVVTRRRVLLDADRTVQVPLGPLLAARG